MIPVRIAATGSYLPGRVVSSAELSKKVRVKQDWIVKRTGILNRRFARPHETNADMACAAARRALKRAGIKAKDLDCILAASITPDRHFPGVAADVQAGLGCAKCPSIDLQVPCNGFVTALSIASAYIATGQYQKILIVASELHSRYLDFSPRHKDLCVLFGDGAGAAVVERSSTARAGILGFELHTEGYFAKDLCAVRAPGGSDAHKGLLGIQPLMNKNSVIWHSSRSLHEVALSIFKKHKLRKDDIDHLIPHQSNKILIQALAHYLNFPMSRVVINIENVGNTGSASIPIALDEAILARRIRRGDLLLFTSFGAGFSWGAALVRY